MQQPPHLPFARALFAYAQRAVEVALHEDDIVADEGEIFDAVPAGREHGDDRRSDQPVVAPGHEHGERGQQHECERQFEVSREDARRHEPDEQAPQRAAERDRQIELRQVPRGRLAMRQLAIAEQRRKEQPNRVQRHRDRHIKHTARGRQPGGHADDQHQRDEQPPVLLVPTAAASALEGDHERQQVQRKRQHPQERDRRDVLCDVARAGEQHHRAQRREGQPEQRVAH